jgi:transcription antitermination factor NusG
MSCTSFPAWNKGAGESQSPHRAGRDVGHVCEVPILTGGSGNQTRKKTETTRKFFPGYLIVNMNPLDENNQLWKTWYFIKETMASLGSRNGIGRFP